MKILYFSGFRRFGAISHKFHLGVGLTQNAIENVWFAVGSQNEDHRNRYFVYFDICENWRFPILVYGDTVNFLWQSRVWWIFLALYRAVKSIIFYYIDHKHSFFRLGLLTNRACSGINKKKHIKLIFIDNFAFLEYFQPILAKIWDFESKNGALLLKNSPISKISSDL